MNEIISWGTKCYKNVERMADGRLTDERTIDLGQNGNRGGDGNTTPTRLEKAMATILEREQQHE